MATPTIAWYYWFDPLWENFTEYVLNSYGVDANWGMGGNEYTDRLANAGEMRLTVKNKYGEFDPDNASALTGLAINTKVKLVITFDGVSWVRFYGSITNIQFSDPTKFEHTATLTISDWMDNAYRFTINQQSIETNKRGDQVADTIVTATGKTPLATAYDVGDNEFPAAFDSMTVKTTAATELNKIVLSEGGYFYNRHDKVNGETLVFESASHRNGLHPLSKIPVMKASSGYILKAGSATDCILQAGSADKLILNQAVDASFTNAINYHRNHGENILNKITVTAYPKRTDTTEQILYSLGDVIKISSGETKVINVRYQNATTKENCNAITSLMIQPIATTDYLMNTKKDGTGTDITSDLTVSVVYRTAEAEITLTNGSAYTGKITKLKLRGYGVYQDSSINSTSEDSASQTEYGNRELNIEQQYQRDTGAGKTWADKILEREKLPRTILNSVDFIANNSDSLMLAFLSMDIGDLVKIEELTLELDNYYYINGVEFNIDSGGVISYSWLLTEAQASVTNGTLTLASMEFTYASNQLVAFGRLREAEDKSGRTVIVSVYPHTYRNQSIIDYGAISVDHSYDSCRYQFYLKYDSGTEMYMGHTNAGFSGDYGYWFSSKLETNITTDAWSRIAVTSNPTTSDAIESLPSFYLNGSSVALQGVERYPAGSKLSEEGIELFVGGSYLSDTDLKSNNFDGLLKNVLIYDRQLSAAEIALDAAGTLITDGLIFRGLAIPTSKTAAYYDEALTTSQHLYDDVMGKIGVPYGAPTCKEII